MAVRAMNQTFTIKIAKKANIATAAWYAVVGGGVKNGVQIPYAGSIPANFDPLFGIGGKTDLGVTTSWNYVGAPSFDYKVAKAADGTVDTSTEQGELSGLGNYTMGPSRKWFSPGIDYLTIQLLMHEMLHVVGYTHTDDDNKNALAGWAKDAEGNPVLDGVGWKDVNYGVGQLLTNLFSHYMYNNEINFETKYGLSSLSPTVLAALHKKVYDRDDTSKTDSLGYNKGWYMTTQDIFFPMDYYGVPSISKASTTVVSTDTEGTEHPLSGLFQWLEELKNLIGLRSPGETVSHDAVKRVLGQKAYTLDLQNTANHTKWDVYNRIKNADRALFDWECSSQQTDCYGRPKTDSSKKPDHFGQAFYYRTDAVWRYQSPKNTP